MRSREWQGSADTLSDGRIVVRNPAVGVWDSTNAWRLESDLRIGTASGTGANLFASIRAIEVDAYGRIYILEGQSAEVRVFTSDGAHLRTFGRRGEGPGEFRFPTGMTWAPDGRLWVADPGNARYAVFDTTGAYVAFHRSSVAGIMLPWLGGIDTVGRLYDQTWINGEDALVRSRGPISEPNDALPLDTFPLPNYRRKEILLLDARGTLQASMPVPFTPMMLRHIDPRAYVWFGVSDQYRIVQARFTGDTIRIIERAYDPLPVHQEEVDSALKFTETLLRAGGRLEGAASPSIKPAYEWFTVDDRGFLWVYASVSMDERGRVLDVFDDAGRFLGGAHANFRFDPRFRPLIRGADCYMVLRDELDVPYVIRARIVGRQD